VGDGRLTSFWLDSWIGRPLCDRFPALFSHALDKEVCVGSVLSAGVLSSLVPRLNTSGRLQLPLILDILASATPLSGDVDKRCLSRCSKRGGALDAAELFRLCTWGGVNVPYHDFVWGNFAPSKVQFFTWTLSRGRTPTRSELARKRILTQAEARCPLCDHRSETAGHLFLECAFARRFWAAARVRFPPRPRVEQLHAYGDAAAVPTASASTYILLCCWNLWKHRNAVVFREQQPSLLGLLRLCKEDAGLWRARLPHACAHDADVWLANLSSRD
jgi:hypothetical protein